MALLAVLVNASEAFETQGVIRITCRKEVLTDEGVKTFLGLTPGIYDCLVVEDNGKGMKEEIEINQNETTNATYVNENKVCIERK